MESDHTPRHYAVIDTTNRKITIEYDGTVIASSTNTLALKEVGRTVMDTVYYFPKSDVLVDLLPENHRHSFCPIKGEASYWNLASPTTDYFAWSYDDPLPKSKKIKEYVAFNPNYVLTILGPLANN